MNESNTHDVQPHLELAIRSLDESLTANLATDKAHGEAVEIYGNDTVRWFNRIATTDIQKADNEMSRALDEGTATEAVLEGVVRGITSVLSGIGAISEDHRRAVAHTVRAEDGVRQGREGFSDLTATLRKMRAGIYGTELSAQTASGHLEQAGATEHSSLADATQQINSLLSQASTYNDNTREVIAPLTECQSADLPTLHASLTELITDSRDQTDVLAETKENITSALGMLENALSSLRSYNALGQGSVEKIRHTHELTIGIEEKAQTAVTRLENYRSTPGEMRATATAAQKSIQQFSRDL